ncbi:MAG TPA: ATP-binding protein [Chryseosolibacter sp.]|nr:ATP-binding protein [Chryseosolibacter sp.]
MLLEISGEEKLIAELFGNQPDQVVWLTPIFSDSQDALVVDFEVRYCNAAACKILGTDPQHIIGSTLLNSSPADIVSVNQVFEQCMKVWYSGEPFEFTYHRQGLDRYFNVQRSKVNHGILSITRDRTAEVKGEKERETQALLMSKIINNSPTFIVLCRAVRGSDKKITDFDIILANDKIANELKRSKEEIQSTTYCRLDPQANTNGLLDILISVNETGQQYHNEIYLDVFGAWFLLTVDKIEDDTIVATYLNIHSSKTASTRIEEQAKLLSVMLNSSLNGVYTLDAVRDQKGDIIDFTIAHVNEVFCQMSSRKREHLVGKSFTKTFPDSKSSGVFERNCKVLADGVQVRQQFNYKGDGVNRWYENCVNKVTENQLVISFNDITAMKMAAVELENTINELKHSNEKLSDFTQAASHDLNEPLRKISTYVDLIQDRFGSELNSEVKAYLTKVNNTASRMQLLINNLLTYSQINKKDKDFQKVSLSTIIQEVKNDLETLIKERKARIIVNTLPEINGDKVQLTQVFQNLLTNAIKFQKDNDGPFIQIRQEPSRTVDGIEYFCISVRDNGIGFDVSNTEKIFQVFYRLHNRREYEGTGIGLAIVRKAMENHEGIIEVESRPGVGSCFYLLFPTPKKS